MTVKLPIHDHDHRSQREPEASIGTIHRHAMAHLGPLQVGRSMLDYALAPACDSNACTSQCCGTGVYADRAEKERILAHVAEVIATMDPDQPHDPALWFDAEEIDDDDFPSKLAVGTQTIDRGCVFLNQRGRCVLQKANIEGRVPVLKPFYCTAFPITTANGMLVFDVDNVEGTKSCCQPTEGGTRTVLDAFGYEAEFMLGAEGVAELRAILAAATTQR